MEGLDASLTVEIVSEAVGTPVFRFCIVAKDAASL
jgi:hypothetical protein